MSDHTTPQSQDQLNIPYGYCHCGCGQLAPVAKRSDYRRGHVKGAPIKFIRGHNPTPKSRPAFVEPDLGRGSRAIQLTRGKYAIVDAADYAWLSQWRWYAVKSKKVFYAERRIPLSEGERSSMRMHQLLAGLGCDHIDGDGLNNRRANLRPATVQQNNCNQGLRVDNTSGYKGVSWDREHNGWRAQVFIDRKAKYLGCFSTAREAARAYNIAARKLHGEFARLNDVEGDDK